MGIKPPKKRRKVNQHKPYTFRNKNSEGNKSKKGNHMALERTFSIVKPDAVKRNLIGEIYNRIEKAGLRVVAAKMLHLTDAQARGFYAEHEGKEFFPPLKEFMISGPVMVQVLEGENAIERYRELMGTTNPDNAACGTIRNDYALSMRFNSVHGSDSPASAAREIEFFFPESEICPRVE